MFLFKKKKLKTSQFQQFPEIPKESKLPKFPSYKALSKKPEIPPLPPFKGSFDIPERKPAVKAHGKIVLPSFKEISPKPKQIFREKSLYIKMEEFEKILNTLELIKNKINNAESTLLGLEKFKEKEDIELSRWKDEINKIKENLISVERRLSGSQI